MVLKVLGPRESCGVGVGAPKGVGVAPPSRLANACPMDGKLCEFSGEPAAEGVGACSAGNSRLFGRGIVYLPTLEAARLSCLGLPTDCKGRGGEVCLTGKGDSAKIGSCDTRPWNDSWNEGKEGLGSSGNRFKAPLAVTTWVSFGLEGMCATRIRLSSSESASIGGEPSPICRASSGLLGARLFSRTTSANDGLSFLFGRRLGERPSELVGLEELSLLPFADARRCFSCRNGGTESSGPYLTTEGCKRGERFNASSESYTSEYM